MDARHLRKKIEAIKDLVLADPLVMRMALESLLTDGCCVILLDAQMAVTLDPYSITLDARRGKYIQRVDGKVLGEFSQEQILILRRYDSSEYA